MSPLFIVPTVFLAALWDVVEQNGFAVMRAKAPTVLYSSPQLTMSADLLDGLDLDAAEKSLAGVMKPVVKSSVVAETLRDHTQLLRKLVQVGRQRFDSSYCDTTCVTQWHRSP